MADPQLTLYHFPGACSRVSICALEMAQLPYDLKLINIVAGEQGQPSYQAISPMGKVPALIVDGDTLLENGAIITLIHELRPQAGILPSDGSPRVRAEGVGGLSFCSGTLHPQIRGMINPQRLTVGDGEPVREKSRELAAKSFAYAEGRLNDRGWWLGELSIVDVYLDWAFGIARKGGLETERYPTLSCLEERLSIVPAYQRMLQRETQDRAELGL